jgi:hypothetical protein
MHELMTFARRNPLIVVGVAALAGWALGSGLVSIPALPSTSSSTPATSTGPAPAAQLVGSTSASMPVTASSDALAGWNV